MDTTFSPPTGTSVAPTPASARKRKTHSIIFSNSSTPLSLSSSHTTTEAPILTHPPLRIMTKSPSTILDQPNASLHSYTTAATATTTTAAAPSTTNRRQFRVSATFGGSGSNSGSGSSLLTSSTPSSASSPLSPLAETQSSSPTILFTTSFPFSSPSSNLGTPNLPSSPSPAVGASAAAARKVSPTQGCHPLNTTHTRTETETDSGASVKAKTAQETDASSSSPTPALISSPLKSSTFGNFYFLPTDTADTPSSPLRDNLMGGTGHGSGVGPLDCAMDTTVHPMDRPTLVSNPLMSDTILEEDEEQQQLQHHPLDLSPRLRQQGLITTPFTTALNRPRARYTFGYDEPLISSLPPRENSISSSSSCCPSPTSPRSPATTASPPPPKSADMTTTPVVLSAIKKKSLQQQDVLSTLPMSSAVHSPRLHSTSSPSTPPSSSSPTRVYPPPSPEGLRPPRSLQRVPSKSTPRPPPPPTPTPQELTAPISPPASPRLSGRKRFSFLANLLGTTPSPPWSSSTSSFDAEKPLPATPPTGSSQLHRHHSLQQQQHGRHGNRHPSSARPQKFKNASAIDLPSYAASMTPSTTTSTSTTTATTMTTTGTSTTKSASATYLNQYQDVKSIMPPAPSNMMMIMNKNRGGSNASMKALYDHYDDRNHSYEHQDTSSIYHLHENYYSHEGEGGRSGGGDGGGESDHSVGRSHQSHEEGGLAGERQTGEYLSPSSTNPYSVSQTSLKIQILPSISQYALHRHQPFGTADGGGVSSGQSRSRSRLDLTIVLVPENSLQAPDNKFDSLNNNPDPSEMNSPQAASPRKGKKRCASLSIFRYFLKK